MSMQEQQRRQRLPEREHKATDGWSIFGKLCAGVIVATVVGLTLASVKDIDRYIKISNM